ncbi:MAG: hypothetical protein GX622_12215 [Bacteroidales bacterium]|nr:hypothetical protein [Bacteroidales bacterium]
MDELEKHIKSVRDDLDTEIPGPGLWKRIKEDLPRMHRSLPGYLWRAAVAVIVAGAALAIIAGVLRTSERLNDPQVAEVRETYRYYDNKIKSLYEEAEPLLIANPEISSELTTGMNELDSLSARIISDLQDNVASREVIEALIYNYRLRIELLEDMLRLMKEHENETGKMTGNEL